MTIKQLIREVERVTERITSDFDAGKLWSLIERDKPYSQVYRRLEEYETAEEEGRLVVLPCKVGEKIYAIYTGSTGKNPTIMRTSFDYGLIPYFGKSVFLSYEEAEKALEEMKGMLIAEH